METDRSEDVSVFTQVARVRALADARQRGRQATALIEDCDAARVELSRIRREALSELIKAGVSQDEAAKEFGITKGRISQIKKSGPPIERAFLGTRQLTVALPLKRDAEYERPAMSYEDVFVWDRLRTLAEANQLPATQELIGPHGEIDLNRPDLLVVCGPKPSTKVASLLESDPAIRFEQTESGRYFLRDLRDGRQYDSPGDVSERQADYAYLARLPRPDGNGNVLILTGIHAVGSLGVVDYLENNLNTLYEAVDTRRFSAILEVEYDDQRQITQSRLATRLYDHEGN